ncbi:hypothetical protein PtrSN002B_009962 [Pyrenophora tritici-repentis]|uniref:Uncharacterized protein n=2 Tax=Pyrenophora tritici-repentis TaxID=45151 RepID=A0A2W1G8W7_9PLEO|nr:uncharacterized protein PTRG_09969 [Pyrenophora tritici-repentis Pt-1C-BFP]KAA8621647.1 hypothetical protein PtrV1_06148 [Pyrenophora tritici-repentis]EDU43020.1 predicted protein [Pyrenophora tritici-repentis Pt-1C-BFP]KAF7450877.1 hypothetical protein A1F99_054930 [Pyrenophora tritici-repentis]KAF7573542.1 hypothetical protein PtrM4_084470 [Pyrenophora tritici-repentis]KAG9380909.1 hypothetical protein A1F94_008229 [Pyrenophora tritici-repentis]
MKEASPSRIDTKPTPRATTTARLHRRYTSRSRPITTLILLLICVPLVLYHVLPCLTQAINNFITSHLGNSSTEKSSFCTQNVGSQECCAIYLTAQPCLDECAKLYIDRETMGLTAQYDECADQCLVRYNWACKKDKKDQKE